MHAEPKKRTRHKEEKRESAGEKDDAEIRDKSSLRDELPQKPGNFRPTIRGRVFSTENGLPFDRKVASDVCLKSYVQGGGGGRGRGRGRHVRCPAPGRSRVRASGNVSAFICRFGGRRLDSWPARSHGANWKFLGLSHATREFTRFAESDVSPRLFQDGTFPAVISRRWIRLNNDSKEGKACEASLRRWMSLSAYSIFRKSWIGKYWFWRGENLIYRTWGFVVSMYLFSLKIWKFISRCHCHPYSRLSKTVVTITAKHSLIL